MAIAGSAVLPSTTCQPGTRSDFLTAWNVSPATVNVSVTTSVSDRGRKAPTNLRTIRSKIFCSVSESVGIGPSGRIGMMAVWSPTFELSNTRLLAGSTPRSSACRAASATSGIVAAMWAS